MKLALALLALAAPPAVGAAALRQGERAAANPIRKVVTMLQSMQAKVTAEGKRDAELYEKFECYCKKSGGTLSAEIAEAKNKIESLTAALEEAREKEAQTKQSEKEHQASRADAKDAIAKATALREGEARAFAKEESDLTTNVAALAKAIPAIEGGMAGAFLQTGAAQALRRFALDRAELSDGARQALLSFLAGGQGQGYVPKSQEIVGILKQIKDEMDKDLADATAAEKAAIQGYEALVASKRKEIGVLTRQIEAEQKRIGELGVEIATTSNDLEDTKESLGEDELFLAELEKGCDTKAKDWEVVKQTRADELQALAETIRVLNDDDALELFKKTLPSTSASFVQLGASARALRAQALAALRSARSTGAARHLPARPELDLIAMALSGHQQGFEKVVSMIDELVANLKREQQDDDSKREYCLTQLDASDDQKKSLELSVSDSETAIEEMEGSIAALGEGIAALEAAIKALDKSVADATAQRKAEHEAYTELMTDNTNAKELLLWAKNRLYKYYEPKLHKAAPKRELGDAESIMTGLGETLAPAPAPGGIANTGIGAAFVQVSAHASGLDAPPPPPETFGAYAKKSEEGRGVVQMIDLLVRDLDKEMQVAGVEEKDAQAEYEAMMAEAAKKRADDSKSMADKTSAKAQEEEALLAEKESKAGTSKELAMTLRYIASLHGECDWLLKYYEARKQARAGEVDALGKAKAVLSGADYSLLQTARAGARAFLGPRA